MLSVCVLCGSPVWPSPPVVGPLSSVGSSPLCGSPVGGSPSSVSPFPMASVPRLASRSRSRSRSDVSEKGVFALEPAPHQQVRRCGVLS